jgi:2'-5' RNA ligase
MYLRCFIAIEISEPIKRVISELIEVLKNYDGDVKWVDSENLHLTLKFLGNTSEGLIPKIIESLTKITFFYDAFYIKLCTIGMFPNNKYPKVIWAGVEMSDILKKLQGDIEDSMSLLGYQREDKNFHSHLTLGRVRSQKGIANLIQELNNFTEKDFGSIKVSDIKLMQSELKPTGAHYYCLHKIQLGRKV